MTYDAEAIQTRTAFSAEWRLPPRWASLPPSCVSPHSDPRADTESLGWAPHGQTAEAQESELMLCYTCSPPRPNLAVSGDRNAPARRSLTAPGAQMVAG